MIASVCHLCDSEINFEVSCFYDAGFNVRLGDEINGFAAQDQLASWDQSSPGCIVSGASPPPCSARAERQDAS
jgi:hypothetical protein